LVDGSVVVVDVAVVVVVVVVVVAAVVVIINAMLIYNAYLTFDMFKFLPSDVTKVGRFPHQDSKVRKQTLSHHYC